MNYVQELKTVIIYFALQLPSQSIQTSQKFRKQAVSSVGVWKLFNSNFFLPWILFWIEICRYMHNLVNGNVKWYERTTHCVSCCFHDKIRTFWTKFGAWTISFKRNPYFDDFSVR